MLAMRLALAVRLGLTALRRHRLRTLLTVLGMIIGVAAVISVAALGAGARESIEDRISASGANMIVIRAGNRTIGGVRLGMGASSRLRDDDAEAIRALAGVAWVSPGLRTRGQVIHAGQNWNTSIEGAGADMLPIHNWSLARGSFFTAREVRDAEKVAVLGSAVRDQIFGPGVDPVGTTVRIGQVPVKVIGVLESKGSSAGGQDQDDTVFVPYTLVQKRMMGVTYLDRITISARSADDIDRVAAGAAALLRFRHEIVPGEPDDFRVQNLKELAELRSAATDTMTRLLGGVAAVSLLVGGIGIMNMMLVAVTERTREIGLRTAIGARARDVRLQFLVEASLLSTGGGLLGVLVGLGAAHGFEAWLGWPATVPVAAVILSFVVSVAVGVAFGFYPAARASRIEPIDALRFE
jgi:putative ABC transport system permease protein